jgi:phosphate:Na+ symporter
LSNQYRVGAESRALIVEYHREVGRALDMAIEALVLGDADQARRVSDMKGDLDAMAQAIAEHYARRLAAPDDHRIELYRFETDLVVNLKRVYYFAKRTARAAIPTSDQATS